MITPEILLQAIRTWLKAECAVTPLTDNQVVPAYDGGPRPAMPYLVVKVTAPGTPVGEDEDLRELDEDDAPTFRTRGQRRAVVSVQGFGSASAEWLERAASRLRHPTSLALVDGLGLTIEPMGGLQDLAQLVDTGFEDRWMREFDVSYAQLTDPESQSEAVVLELAAELGSNTFTADLG